MKHMAGRKKHSAEDIVRKLRRADELAAAGQANEEIASDLEVSPATLYYWRRSYGGMYVDAAKELWELGEQNSRLKRLFAEAELKEDALREVAKGKILSPDAKRRAADMLKDVLSMSERLASGTRRNAASTRRSWSDCSSRAPASPQDRVFRGQRGRNQVVGQVNPQPGSGSGWTDYRRPAKHDTMDARLPFPQLERSG